MILNKYFSTVIIFVVAILLNGCGGGSGSNTPTIPVSGLTNGPTLPAISGVNVLPLTVGGTLCSSNSNEEYANKPCVTVKVCDVSGTSCDTITDVLLDTGSFGFRVFKTALSSSTLAGLTPVTAGGNPVAECTQYGDGSIDWGYVVTAGIVLGGEPMVTVPIEIISTNSTTPTIPSSCLTSGTFQDTNPVSTGYTAILGVGLFAQDCGSTCVTASNNDTYYSCGSTCVSTALPLTSQVTNPVTALTQDNNGVILELPSVALGGLASINTAYLVLGIGTRSNNTPSNVTAFSTDQNGEYTDVFSGTGYESFVDSGSNALLFPGTSAMGLPDCSGSNSSFFCPTSTLSFSAVNTAASGSPTSQINFQVGNMVSLQNTGDLVFVELGGSSTASDGFDWGLPFFMGRNVYVGFESTSSSLGAGPYWAY
jgi:hypothetical protein